MGTGGGGYLVQLSSQRSEGEAQSSFRSLQAKFPNQLGGRAAVVKRADLGAKGTFYRSMVGPFASSGEADQFCPVPDLRALARRIPDAEVVVLPGTDHFFWKREREVAGLIGDFAERSLSS